MKKFALDRHMVAAIGGAFYPTGHAMIMFPNSEDASRISHQLVEDSVVSGDEVYLISPEEVLEVIAPTVEATEHPLPSAGTDAATVRTFTRLAQEGHSAVLVRIKDDDAAERMMALVRQVPYSIAQRYRRLVIEDL